MKFEFVPIVGDVDMSWEIPQPATGDFAGLPVDGDPIGDLCWCGAVLTVAERPSYPPEDMEDDEPNPMMPAGLYFMIADGLGYYSGAEFYRPCDSVEQAKAYLAELTVDDFKANVAIVDDPRFPLADQDWIRGLGWTSVDL